MPQHPWVLGDIVKRASTRCLLGELRARPLADIPNDYRFNYQNPQSNLQAHMSAYPLVDFNAPL